MRTGSTRRKKMHDKIGHEGFRDFRLGERETLIRTQTKDGRTRLFPGVPTSVQAHHNKITLNKKLR